ncbi:MAG: hypothetical protein JWM34_5165 [Ilumatobacteraceae bacterium]|nr:hypothetical protein [Ilumatobacteraceae bacterium]
MSSVHILVWVDHERARLIELSGGESRAIRIGVDPFRTDTSTPAPPPLTSTELYEGIADALADAEEIVIAGPSHERVALARHLEVNHPALGRRVIAIEQMGNATDTMLRMYARTYFRISDRLGPR